MRIINVTRADLEMALAHVSFKYSQNIHWGRSPTQRPNGWWRFTLEAIDPDKPGAQTIGEESYLDACWHVHHDFLRELLELAAEPETVHIDSVLGSWPGRTAYLQTGAATGDTMIDVHHVRGHGHGFTMKRRDACRCEKGARS